MSSELLLNDPLSDSTPLATIVHDVVHDLESFFWVLCWLATKFNGPDTENPDFEKVEEQFYGVPRAVGFGKKQVILVPDRRNVYIVNHVTEFFEPLKATINRLAELLKEHYITRNFEGLHEKFLEVLDNAENDCRESTLPYNVWSGETSPAGYRFPKPLAELQSQEWARRHDDLLPPVAPSQCIITDVQEGQREAKRQRR